MALAGSACGRTGMVGTPEGPPDARRPLQLVTRGPDGGAGRQSLVMPLDEAELARAIENYRINRRREPGGYRAVGVDLNGNGRAEAVVLFDGEDWCAPTGCTLAVFQLAERGYRAVFHIVRVKAPVMVADASNNGWRHLIVMSGGAGASPLRQVQLRFGDKGYPANAMLEPGIPDSAEVAGEVVIDAAPTAEALAPPR